MVRRISTERWRQVERRHGSIRHMFDGFGQIKPQYRLYAAGAGGPGGASEGKPKMQDHARTKMARGSRPNVIDIAHLFRQ